MKENGVKCQIPDFYDPLMETIYGEWIRGGNKPLSSHLKTLQKIFQQAFRTAYTSGTDSQIFQRHGYERYYRFTEEYNRHRECK